MIGQKKGTRTEVSTCPPTRAVSVRLDNETVERIERLAGAMSAKSKMRMTKTHVLQGCINNQLGKMEEYYGIANE